jgi:hypothetical protein
MLNDDIYSTYMSCIFVLIGSCSTIKLSYGTACAIEENKVTLSVVYVS